eukprot:TRINITY_DN33039_c0_g1_i1.p1 TRINITY_DN33039_c0_g1~~TRINITY_DN33039_c0_g1_i1.p1  ORF type:complete len:939 (-),score=16.19 TRINITY_DN33039_c0_g1_i1:391-3207(-)
MTSSESCSALVPKRRDVHHTVSNTSVSQSHDNDTSSSITLLASSAISSPRRTAACEQACVPSPIAGSQSVIQTCDTAAAPLSIDGASVSHGGLLRRRDRRRRRQRVSENLEPKSAMVPSRETGGGRPDSHLHLPSPGPTPEEDPSVTVPRTVSATTQQIPSSECPSLRPCVPEGDAEGVACRLHIGGSARDVPDVRTRHPERAAFRGVAVDGTSVSRRNIFIRRVLWPAVRAGASDADVVHALRCAEDRKVADAVAAIVWRVARDRSELLPMDLCRRHLLGPCANAERADTETRACKFFHIAYTPCVACSPASSDTPLDTHVSSPAAAKGSPLESLSSDEDPLGRLAVVAGHSFTPDRATATEDFAGASDASCGGVGTFFLRVLGSCLHPPYEAMLNPCAASALCKWTPCCRMRCHFLHMPAQRCPPPGGVPGPFVVPMNNSVPRSVRYAHHDPASGSAGPAESHVHRDEARWRPLFSTVARLGAGGAASRRMYSARETSASWNVHSSSRAYQEMAGGRAGVDPASDAQDAEALPLEALNQAELSSLFPQDRAYACCGEPMHYGICVGPQSDGRGAPMWSAVPSIMHPQAFHGAVGPDVWHMWPPWMIPPRVPYPRPLGSEVTRVGPVFPTCPIRGSAEAFPSEAYPSDARYVSHALACVGTRGMDLAQPLPDSCNTPLGTDRPPHVPSSDAPITHSHGGADPPAAEVGRVPSGSERFVAGRRVPQGDEGDRGDAGIVEPERSVQRVGEPGSAELHAEGGHVTGHAARDDAGPSVSAVSVYSYTNYGAGFHPPSYHVMHGPPPPEAGTPHLVPMPWAHPSSVRLCPCGCGVPERPPNMAPWAMHVGTQGSLAIDPASSPPGLPHFLHAPPATEAETRSRRGDLSPTESARPIDHPLPRRGGRRRGGAARGRGSSSGISSAHREVSRAGAGDVQVPPSD